MNELLTPAEIEVDGTSVSFMVHNTGAEYHISSDKLRTLSISSCMNALRVHTAAFFPESRENTYIIINLGTERRWWEPSWADLYVTDKGSYFDIEFIVNAAIGMQDVAATDIVSSCVNGSAFSISNIEHDKEEYPSVADDGWHGWDINLSVGSEATVKFDELLRIRSRISQEVFLPREALTVPFLILRTLQNGDPAALVGQTESEWLEVKSSAYDLKGSDEAHWKLELALDVAQFANSSNGGLLLIGYHTKRISGKDTIDKIIPVPHSQTRLQTYGDVLKHKIHPPISGLEIGSIPYNNSEIIYLYVPAQQDENKPYLVTGAIIDGCYIGSAISIVRRQGDASIPVTAQEIHSALAIGRALMRKH